MMGERIKELRKILDLTQKEFGERIGVKPNTIGTYEIGRNEPIDAVVSLICREFNVNETWLREGKGERFIKQDRNKEISEFMENILKGDVGFRRRLISVLARLDSTQWELLEKVAWSLVDEMRLLTPDSTKTSKEIVLGDSESGKDPEIVAEAEAYYQRRLEEKKRASQISAVKESGVG